MGLLHIRIKQADEIINLDRGLHSQNFTLKKAVVVKGNSATTEYKGGATVTLDFFNGGLQIMSNVVDNDLIIPFNDQSSVTDIRYDINLSSENITRSFRVNVQNFDKTFIPTFNQAAQAAGELAYIDLFFEFTELYDYDRY